MGCGVILMLGLFSLYLDFKEFVKQEELEEQQLEEQQSLEAVHRLFSKVIKKAKLTSCRLVFIRRSQFFQSLR
jgi:L-fucose mutarotase/ribose pyranase (RbsD/FucU family)